MSERHRPVTATPVFDCGRPLGQLVEMRCGQVEAIRQNGESLGHYNSERAALAALIGTGGVDVE